MQYRSIVIAALSTSIGIAALQATTALSAFWLTPSKAEVSVPASSMQASVVDVVSTADGPVVLLQPEGTDQFLPIWIGHAEARAIKRALAGVKMNRPRTHDLFANTLSNLDARLVHVRVDRLRGGVYYGTATLQQGDRVISIDARPSDAMALALRTSATIYVADELRAELIAAKHH